MDLLYKFLIHTKMIYLYLLYWLVGITQEDFYISKANYLIDLGLFDSAIKYYEKALSESKDPLIYACLGFCYLQKGKYNLAVENYRIAYKKNKLPNTKIGLAIAELNNSNKEESIILYQDLEKDYHKFNERDKEYFSELKNLLNN